MSIYGLNIISSRIYLQTYYCLLLIQSTELYSLRTHSTVPVEDKVTLHLVQRSSYNDIV